MSFIHRIEILFLSCFQTFDDGIGKAIPWFRLMAHQQQRLRVSGSCSWVHPWFPSMSSLRTKALLPRIRCLHHGKPTGCRELRWYLRLRSDPIRVDDGPKRNAKSIEEKNVRYVSDRDLVNDVNLRCKLTRAGWIVLLIPRKNAWRCCKITWLMPLIPLFVWQIMPS